MGKRLCIGIIFNSYVKVDRYESTQESEIAVETTAQEVLRVVTKLGYSAFLYPLGDSLSRFFAWMETSKPDVIINLCEGYKGHPQFEANVAAVLELEELAFTGNASKTLALCQDKHKTKIIIGSLGYRTPKFKLVTSLEDEVDLAFPIIVKPNFEDASLGINMDSVTHSKQELWRKIENILETYGQPALAEEYIEGREFNVAVFENTEPVALQVSEIDFSGMPEDIPHICSYEAKWLEEHPHFKNSAPLCPAPIAALLRDLLQQTAVDVFLGMDCRDYARVDFRVTADGIPYILEINPNPDISLNAGYVRALSASGIEYQEFWDLTIQNALRRKSSNDPIHAKIRQKFAH